MLTIRTATQIRGIRNLKSFRSCGASTGVPVRRADARRILRAETVVENSQMRGQWLARQWDTHQARARRAREG